MSVQDLTISAGNGISLTENLSASTITIENATKKSCFLPLNESTALTGTETRYISIPAEMNGWYLQAVGASSGSSTSGSPAFTVYRSSASSVTKVNMLSTNITIDQGEYDSSTAITAPVISTTASAVWTGDKIWASSAGSALCGTNVLYAGVRLTFQNMP